MDRIDRGHDAMQNSSETLFYVDYHEKDLRWAEWISWHLEQQTGYKVHFNGWDLQAGQNREQIFQQLLARYDFIIAVLSPHYDISDKDSILSSALARDRREGQNRILPVRVEECDPPGQLSPLIPIDLVGLDDGEALRTLINWISRKRRKPEEPPAISALRKSEPVAVEEVRLSISPSPLWHVPYPLYPSFVGRETLLSEIETILNAEKIAAIAQPEKMTSPGGIGKTQIAIQYAHRHYPNDYKFVLWAKADAPDIFSWDLLSIATRLKLPEKDVLDRTLVVQAVKRWLLDHTDWLLILDNVGEPEIVTDFLSLTHEDGSSPGNRRHVLLTTRTQALRNTAHYIELQPLEVKEGALLLLRQAGRVDNALETDRSAAQEISQAMQGHPLALEHAGAYIAKTATDLFSYLSIYRERQAALAQQIAPSLSPEPVSITWFLSFKVINPVPQKLLYLCAFLHPEAISQEMIFKGIQDLDLDLSGIEINQPQLGAAFSELVDYALLARVPNEKSLYTISPLLQTLIRSEMDEVMRRKWGERVVHIVNRAFPMPDFTTSRRCRSTIPQASTSIGLIKQWNIETVEAAQLLDRVGYYLGYYVQEPVYFAKAVSFCTWGLNIRIKLLGEHHPDVATSHNHLALLYRIQGNVEGNAALAEEHYQQACVIRQQLLDADGTNPTPEHLDDLAHLYYSHREYDLAEPLYKQALKIREQKFGEENPAVVISLNNLAELYSIQGKYALAEPLYQRALTISGQALSLNVANAVDVIHNLKRVAEFYMTQGDYRQAEPLYQRALALSKQTLNPVYVVHSLNNLALFYQHQGKYAQAEVLLKQVLDSQEHLPEPDALSIADCLNKLASLYRIQGKYDQARPLYERAQYIHEQVLGLHHPSVAHDLNNLAFLYYAQGQYDQATLHYERALYIQEQVLGPVHSEVANSLNNLALLYRVQGDYDQALTAYQRVLDIQEQVLGKDHYEVANTLNNMAEVYYAQSEYDQIEPLCRRALGIQEQTLGENHLDVARTLKNLARWHRMQNNYVEAERLYTKIKELYERTWGAEHPNMAHALNNLAVLYRSQGDHLQVDPLYKSILAIYERSLGSEHLDVANVLNNLAMLYRSQADYQQAEWLYRRVLAIHEQASGLPYVHMAIILENYSYLLRKLGREAEAVRMEARAREIRIKHANEELPIS